MAQTLGDGLGEPSSAARKVSRSHSEPKGKQRVVDNGSAVSTPARPVTSGMEVDEMPAAESSIAALNGSRSTPQLGSDTKRLVAPKPKRKHRHGKAKFLPFPAAGPSRQRYEEEGVEECACVPIARAGASTVPPVWSHDGRFFFTVSDTSIHIHSATSPTYSRLSTLSSTHSDGHKKTISAIYLSPLNPFQLVSGSGDGTLKIWNWVEGKLLRSVDLVKSLGCAGLAVLQLCLGEIGDKWWIFFTTSAPKSAKQNATREHLEYRVWRLPIQSSELNRAPKPLLVGKLSSQPVSLIISPSNTYLVALAGTKAYTYRLPSAPKPGDWSIIVTKFVSDQPFTCGAFAPHQQVRQTKEEEWFATGDVKGVIRLWHGLDATFQQIEALAGGQAEASSVDRRLPTTSLHWHAHAVGALAFTPSGAQLLSVGEESVLVQWHIGTGKREFVPRLGGSAIVNLSIKPSSAGAEEEWWLAFSDASTVRIGAASGQISTVGQVARLDPLRPDSPSTPYPFAIHPSTSALVVPSSHSSTLQFIDPTHSTVLFDLEVAPSNRISRRDEAALESVRVEKVAFSYADGKKTEWMATVEGRKGDQATGGGVVKNLKIWQWVGDKYVVNTQYPRPHGLLDVISLGFSPVSTDASERNTYLVTVDSDGSAKMWQVRQTGKQDQGKVSKKSVDLPLFWSLRSTFDYRSLPVNDLAFSPDGTLLALCHSQVISLWDVESNVLLRTLDGVTLPKLRSIGFVGASGRHLAATGETNGAIVWDLLSCEASWADTSVTSDLLVVLPGQSEFLLANIHLSTQATVLSVHSATSPGALRHLVVQESLREIRPLPGTDHSRLRLVGVTTAGEIFRFGDDLTTSHQTAKAVSQVAGPQNRSIWIEMFGKDAFSSSLGETAVNTEPKNIQSSQALQIRARKTGKPGEVFDGPSHTLPPTGMIFDAFVEELLRPDQEMRERGELVDVDMEDPKPIYDRNAGKKDKQVIMPSAVKQDEGRKVGDKEVKELEAFFRDVLSGGKPARAQPKTPAPAVAAPSLNGMNGYSAKSANRSLSNDTPMRNGKSADIAPSSDEESSEESETEERHSIFQVGTKRRAQRQPE